jgi:hypothetical protein
MGGGPFRVIWNVFRARAAWTCLALSLPRFNSKTV